MVLKGKILHSSAQFEWLIIKFSGSCTHTKLLSHSWGEKTIIKPWWSISYISSHHNTSNFISVILTTQACSLITEMHFYKTLQSTVKIWGEKKKKTTINCSNSTNYLSTFDVTYMCTVMLQMIGQKGSTRGENANRSSCPDNRPTSD